MARIFVMISYLVIIAVTARELASNYPDLGHVDSHSYPVVCIPPQATALWKLYVPYLVLQTILFAGTLLPAVRPWRRRQRSQLLKRIVRE